MLLLEDGELKVQVEPVCIGPTWQKHELWTVEKPVYLIPDHLGIATLGWEILEFIARWLVDPDSDEDNPTPWQPTDEQLRFLLWWYAVDKDGRFIYRKGILQRLKGWGKDPLAAVMAIVELVGPCRFKCWRLPDGELSDLWAEGAEPVGKDNRTAYIQVAAVSLDQTENTMDLFSGLMTPEFIERFKIDLGKQVIYAMTGRKIKAVTSSPRSLEGKRPSFVILNETHHWLSNNEGHAMLAVIDRNATKSKGGAARQLSITNAYEPGEDSVAQRQREAWQAEQRGEAIKTGVLYDSLEAPEDARVRPVIIDARTGHEAVDAYGDPLKPGEALIKEYLAAVIKAVRGDATWLDVEGIINSILDTQNPPSQSRRFWFNQVVAAEDAWVDPAWIEKACDATLMEQRRNHFGGDPLRMGWVQVDRADPVVMFGDGSKGDDSTALMGYRMSDGYVFTIGIWNKPTGLAKGAWRAPRGEVDSRVEEAFARFNIVGFLFDPSHAKDEVDSTPYWDGLIDDWHRRFGDRLQFWPAQSGSKIHSIMWDMASDLRQEEFTRAAERVREELKLGGVYRIDGHPALIKHLGNAKAAPGKHGTSLMKEHRESERKIDLAVCLVGAIMLGRFVLNKGLETKKPSKAWWAPVD